MTITTSWDLGGLGSTAGKPSVINWTPLGLLPPMLPWLGLAVLLTVKTNRRPAAYWILLALACTAIPAAVCMVVVQGLPYPKSLPILKHLAEALCDVPLAVAMGVAMLWLAASRLDFSNRLGTALRVLVILVGSSALTYLMTGLWRQGFEQAMEPFLFLPVLLAANIGLALILCGLACRGRYGAIRIIFWMAVSLLICSLLIAGPAGATLDIMCPEGMHLPELREAILPIGILITVLVTAMLAPFLVLSLANSLFRERLKALLKVG